MVNPEILKRKDPELSNLERGQKEVGGGGNERRGGGDGKKFR